MTENEGCWLQTIFYPFMHASLYGRGTALTTSVESPAYDTKDLKDVPYLTCTAVDNGDTVTVFAVNRSLDEAADLDLEGFDGMKLISHTFLTCDDMKATNSLTDPDNIKPEEAAVSDRITLGAHSWNVLRFSK